VVPEARSPVVVEYRDVKVVVRRGCHLIRSNDVDDSLLKGVIRKEPVTART
jgi:hypothetical protein